MSIEAILRSKGGEVVTVACDTPLREAIALLAEVAGIERRVRALPPPLALGAAAAVEALAHARRRKPPICREMVRTLLHGHEYDGSRATRELGLVYTPLEETLRRTLRWYSDEGLLSDPAAAP